jgi:hypothetical protein
VDGTAFLGFEAGDSLTVDEDVEVTFTVAGDGNQEAATDGIVPVLYEGDGDLAVGDDGLPEAEFGIGGQVDFAVEREATEIELVPEASINDLGASHTLTATVEDQFGDGVADVEVDFAIERDGSTIATFERTTDQDGEATLTYAGPSEQAVDSITASFEITENDDTTTGDEATATKWWVDLDAVHTIEVAEEDVSSEVGGGFAYVVDVGFDVRDAATVLWVENDRCSTSPLPMVPSRSTSTRGSVTRTPRWSSTTSSTTVTVVPSGARSPSSTTVTARSKRSVG